MRPKRRRMKKGYLRFKRKNRKFIEWYSNQIRDLCCNFAYIPDYSDDGERVLTVIFSDGTDESKYTIEGVSIIEALDNAVAENEPTLHMLAKAYDNSNNDRLSPPPDITDRINKTFEDNIKKHGMMMRCDQ